MVVSEIDFATTTLMTEELCQVLDCLIGAMPVGASPIGTFLSPDDLMALQNFAAWCDRLGTMEFLEDQKFSDSDTLSPAFNISNMRLRLDWY